jgi:spermidine synthase
MRLNMKIKVIKTINHNDFKALYKDAGWWKNEYDEDFAFIDQVLKGSFLFVAAFKDNGELAGIARALSDGCSDAYIQDVAVLKKYRKQGIGSSMISFLINKLKENGIDWIALIGEPGTDSFYENLGFQTMKNHTPMKLKS